MRIRRAVLPAIIVLSVLSVAGSALTSVTVAAAATSVPTMHYHGHVHVAPMMHYHGHVHVAPMMHYHG